MKIKSPSSKFNNPISEEKIDEFINLLDINSVDTIADFGGGNGEVLLKILNKSDASGTNRFGKRPIRILPKESREIN